MKSASAPLIALLSADNHFEQFDLYTVTLSNGLVLRWANTLFDVSWNSHTFLCGRSGGVIIDEQGQSPRGKWTFGFDVGTWSINILPRPGVDKIGQLDLLSAVRAGILDGAIVSVDRAYIAAWPTSPVATITPVGTINVFTGRVADVTLGQSLITIDMNDPRELLKTDMPRNIYTAQCRYALFDAGCALSKTGFAFTGTVATVPSSSFLTTTITSQADQYFALGTLLFTSGLNSGLTQMIRNSTQSLGALALLAPMPFAVSPGDGITLYPGCDKRFATCQAKFNNANNYGGFPFIPVAETAV